MAELGFFGYLESSALLLLLQSIVKRKSTTKWLQQNIPFVVARLVSKWWQDLYQVVAKTAIHTRHPMNNVKLKPFSEMEWSIIPPVCCAGLIIKILLPKCHKIIAIKKLSFTYFVHPIMCLVKRQIGDPIIPSANCTSLCGQCIFPRW